MRSSPVTVTLATFAEIVRSWDRRSLPIDRQARSETRATAMQRSRDIQRTIDVPRAVLAYIRRERLLPADSHVVVGVSGGPDSLCLLHLLWTQRDELGIQVHAAHLNHLIRGPEADADAQFVTDLAARWGIPNTVSAQDVPALRGEGRHRLHDR